MRLSRYGGDCYAYCMLAAGHVDLVIETGLKPHDIVALIPIIEGAGGVVTSWEGGSAVKGGRVVAAGDRRVHEAALKMLDWQARTAACPARRRRTPPRTARDSGPAPSAFRAARRGSPDASRRAAAPRRRRSPASRRSGPAGRDEQQRLAQAARIARIGELAHRPERRVDPGDRRRADARAPASASMIAAVRA